MVKFDTKMYFNFSHFRGRTSAGGGTSLGPKTGTSVRWGWLAKFSPDGGTPSPPPGKKPWSLCGQVQSEYVTRMWLWELRSCVLWSWWMLALARRSKFSDTARNPAKQRSISSAVLRSLMSVGNATDKAEWRRTYGTLALGLDFGATRRSLAEDN